MELAVIWHSIV